MKSVNSRLRFRSPSVTRKHVVFDSNLNQNQLDPPSIPELSGALFVLKPREVPLMLSFHDPAYHLDFRICLGQALVSYFLYPSRFNLKRPPMVFSLPNQFFFYCPSSFFLRS